MFSFSYLIDAPLIDVKNYPELNGNINGPSLIETPAWLDRSPGRYLLYFAHHEGKAIKLAFSDDLAGPWAIHQCDPLSLADSLFATDSPKLSDLHTDAQAYIEAGADGNYAHIASPDIYIDHARREIRLYYHGRMDNGLQRSRVAISKNGVNFIAQPEVLGEPYLRVFEQDGWFYGIAMPGQLYRSRNGLSQFEPGPRLTEEPIRHHALLNLGADCYFFWTRIGDAPERILVSRLDINDHWLDWRLGECSEVHRPEKAWEGNAQKVEPSQYGGIMQAVNQLRDPAIFRQGDKLYLLYSIAGEQGLGIGELQLEI
ncbi:MAG: hypothetical protein ACI9LO_001007 [Planctomycetota bacterium]|jgi:hypothetical protein